MRLRNVRGAREEMLVNPYVIQEPQQYKGHVAVQIFGNNNPIFIEVGMGKGQFITSLAALHPEINYIGIEKYSSVLIRAIEKQEELQLPNLKFLRFDAEYLPDIFCTRRNCSHLFKFFRPMAKGTPRQAPSDQPAVL